MDDVGVGVLDCVDDVDEDIDVVDDVDDVEEDAGVGSCIVVAIVVGTTIVSVGCVLLPSKVGFKRAVIYSGKKYTKSLILSFLFYYVLFHRKRCLPKVHWRFLETVSQFHLLTIDVQGVTFWPVMEPP